MALKSGYSVDSLEFSYIYKGGGVVVEVSYCIEKLSRSFSVKVVLPI